ncbi:hypothetical protein AJ80_05523 [Polytolypa hystricis UAMH7299]|uniref:CMP/dCMP-type deaminase domain-containing protein n=1 Tax=Polytolypa hystricis (strain UAMH7299) TaxID=1447883 RepID=A0A2B7Y212_POLH7|nr:hypothetical protein AJ80_05523 [Polytolypa hystricis UAMH7299]
MSEQQQRHADDPFADIQPLQGKLVPLKTVQEVRAVERTAEAYVAEIDIKSASKAVKLISSKFRQDPSLNLSHLRRLTKAEFLPEHLKNKVKSSSADEVERGDGEEEQQQQEEGEEEEEEEAKSTAPPIPSPQVLYLLIPPPLPPISELQDLLAPFAAITTTTAAAAAAANNDEQQPPTTPRSPIKISQTLIPLDPPTSIAQSLHWSRTYWPTLFNAAAQPATHSPPPTILARVKSSIELRAGIYLALARRVAADAQDSGRGRRVGAVVVDPLVDAGVGLDGFKGVVAVAGDVRFWTAAAAAEKVEEGKEVVQGEACEAGTTTSLNTSQGQKDPTTTTTTPAAASGYYNPDDEAGPPSHAVMRAISLVAYQRRSISTTTTTTGGDSTTTTPTIPASSSSANTPPIPTPTTLEHTILTRPSNPLLSLTQGGYLCTALDLYLTHEPCLCCAMGMLLSRFRSVTFLRRGRNGRVDAALDPERGYGLHWRQELNWRAYGFEFVEEGEEEGEGEVGEKGEELFHA